jgi:hypothetical protein
MSPYVGGSQGAQASMRPCVGWSEGAHQLSSDLSAVKNASESTLVGVEGAYTL